MSDTGVRRSAELALVGIAAVWGLTFVMVQDAIECLPALAFLGYRFLPPAPPAAGGVVARPMICYIKA